MGKKRKYDYPERYYHGKINNDIKYEKDVDDNDNDNDSIDRDNNSKKY